MEKIPLIKPFIPKDALGRIGEVLKSGYLTEGEVTKEFESLCKQYIGVSHAIAVSNCTVGLEASLRALGIGPGDEVIVPDYTYPATASVVHLVGAMPVLVDVDPSSMLINLDKASEAVTPRTKAIIPVSLFGNPLDYDALNAFKQEHSVWIIEDAACSLGAKYKDSMVGSLADVSVFSMHPRKFITTGEGGLVTTNNPQIASYIEAYKRFGIQNIADREGVVFGMMGTNYKMSNIQAALGVSQMKMIDELLTRRISFASRYTQLLRDVKGIEIPSSINGGRHSFQTFCVFVEDRDQIMCAMNEQGIETQIGTYSLHLQPAFQNKTQCRISADMTGSLASYNRALALPLFHEMTQELQDHIVAVLKALL